VSLPFARWESKGLCSAGGLVVNVKWTLGVGVGGVVRTGIWDLSWDLEEQNELLLWMVVEDRAVEGGLGDMMPIQKEKQSIDGNDRANVKIAGVCRRSNTVETVFKKVIMTHIRVEWVFEHTRCGSSRRRWSTFIPDLQHAPTRT